MALRLNITVIFIVRIVFIPLEQKTNLNCKKGCESKEFCKINMPSEDPKILEFNEYQKSDKAYSFVIYADLECLIEKFDGCQKNPEKLSTTKVGQNIPSCFLLSTMSSF